MNRLFQILLFLSLAVSFLLDRQKLIQANKVEKWIYGLLMGGTAVLCGLSVADIRMPMPTHVLVRHVVPIIQKYMMH